MLTLTPVVVVLAAIAFSHALKTFINEEPDSPKDKDTKDSKKSKKKDEKQDAASEEAAPAQATPAAKPTEAQFGPNRAYFVAMLFSTLLCLFAVHCTWVTATAYSSPSVVLASNVWNAVNVLKLRHTNRIPMDHATSWMISVRPTTGCVRTPTRTRR